MKIEVTVDIPPQAIEVDIDADDIRRVLAESLKNNHGLPPVLLLSGLNMIGQFLRSVSDEQIASLNAGQRSTVHHYLSEQAARYGMGRLAGVSEE